jgi:hypothetical protein
MICIRADLKTCKPILNTEWDDIAIKCLNTLEANWNMDRFVSDIILYHSNWHGECMVDPLFSKAY